MKIRIGAILLIILATVGFSGTMVAQHVGEEHKYKEEHKNRRPHGPPRTNTHMTYIEKRHKPKSHRLNCFQK